MKNLVIRNCSPQDLDIVRGILRDRWGSQMVGSRGILYDASSLPAILAQNDQGEIVGLLTYSVQENELEVVTLDALKKYIGIGTALLNEIYNVARQLGVKRVCLATSNDNIDALRFYQRRGFRLTRVIIDAVTKLREAKPFIPLLGEHGIPLKDELELERLVQEAD